MDSKSVQRSSSGTTRLELSRSSTTSSKKRRRRSEVSNSLVAGSMAGITSTLLVYPMDVLRTKMQSQVGESQKLSGRRPHAPASWQEILRNTIKHGGGFRALYTGLSLPMSAQALYKATVFTVNQASQTILLDWRKYENDKLTLADQFVCGAVGGAVNAWLFVTPVEYVRNQMIVQHTSFTQAAAASDSTAASVLSRLSGPLAVVKTTLSHEGLVGLWRGATITVARDSLGCGCFFYAFHSCQQVLQHDGQHNFGITLISGAAAGLGFWSVALPLDTVKTVVQNRAAPSARAVVRESLQSWGPLLSVKRLCRGWQFAFGRGAPAAAVTLGTYDVCYRALDSRTQ